MNKNPHYDDSQEYKPLKGQIHIEDLPITVTEHGAEITTQDVKSNEVNTDEPKKRRKSRRNKPNTSDKPSES
jgi:hypothetical protein